MKPPKSRKLEAAHDILRGRQHPLDVFFAPERVAVIGATENPGSVGRTLLWNLISNPFGGTVFPVNPKRRTFWASRPIRTFAPCRSRSTWP